MDVKAHLHWSHQSPGIVLLLVVLLNCEPAQGWRDLRTLSDLTSSLFEPKPSPSPSPSPVVRLSPVISESDEILTQDLTSGRAMQFNADSPESPESDSESAQIQPLFRNSAWTPGFSQEAGTHNTMTEGGDFREAALDAINFYRENHDASHLELDPRLNRQAQKHAEFLAKTNTIVHSCKTKRCSYGENLAIVKGQSNLANAARQAVNQWESEQNADFTQLVWKSSQKVGFGMAQNPKTKKLYIVAQFAPVGNIEGRFSSNVAFR